MLRFWSRLSDGANFGDQPVATLGNRLYIKGVLAAIDQRVALEEVLRVTKVDDVEGDVSQTQAAA